MIAEIPPAFTGRVKINSPCNLRHGQVGEIVRMTAEGHYVVMLHGGESVFEQDELEIHWSSKRSKRRRL